MMANDSPDYVLARMGYWRNSVMYQYWRVLYLILLGDLLPGSLEAVPGSQYRLEVYGQ